MKKENWLKVQYVLENIVKEINLLETDDISKDRAVTNIDLFAGQLYDICEEDNIK